MEESREEWSVYEWLEKAGMSEYAESFVDNGYDTPDLCAELQNDDLTAIGVKDKKHRSIIFSKARELLKLMNASEVTDGPVSTPAEPIVVVKQLDTSSPTLPANGTGSYTEPWQSYTEPWAANPPHHSSNGVPTKLRKTGSDDKPPLPPPNKTKKKHPPPSPLPIKDLPAFKRPEGGETGLTKLQLQLKIREELRGEGILLSEPPYVDKEEQLCSQPLSDLAERYSQKLKLQPLDVYDALRVVWNSENSCNVTPLTPASADKTHPLPVILKGNSTENYDEPFDAAGTGVTPDCLKPQSSPKGSKSQTLPSNGSTGNYDEPFDAVNKQQPPPPPQEQKQLESSPERRRQSKTLPSSPKITAKAAAEEKEKKKSKHASADDESSPKHFALAKLFRRKEKGRSHSIHEYDMKQREEKKSGKKGAKISFPMRSKDTLSVSKAQKKQNGSSPRNSKHMCTESSSETDESSPQPTKKHSGNKFKKFITPPTLKRDECPLSGSSSSDESTPETVRKLRAIRSRGLTGSDLEISFRDDGETQKPWMVTSRSFDNLNDVNRDEPSQKKKEGGGNIFSRIFKIRTLQSPARKKTANKQKSKKKASTNRSSLGYEGLAVPNGGESSLANSLSMPDIAAVTLDKKKNRKPFVSSSHTPPEHVSNAEATLTVDSSPRHQAGTPDNTHTNIPVPKPRTLSRTQSPNSGEAIGAIGGSAPIKPSYLSERPTPEPRPRSKTPTSAEGSKNQSPNSSGSDIAMLDSSRSSSLSSQKSLGVPKKPAPPPKPAKIALLDDKSMEAYKFSTLPYGKGVTTSKGGSSPPKPIKQFSVPNGDNSPAALSQSVPNRTLRESEAKRMPPKPVRNFASKADSQPEADTTPLSSVGTRRPGSGGGTGETPPTSGSGSTTAASVSQAASSSPPTPRQRPPPKPARSIKRKPQRDRAVNQGGEEQTPISKEVERPASGSATPPRSNSDSSSDKVVTATGGEATPSSSGAGGPPKPIRRIKSPKVVDSSSPQMEEEKERSSRTFGDRSSNGSGTGDGNETNTKHAMRIINVSTPSPTSSSPTTTNEEGGNSFAEAAAFAHNTSATTAEVTKSTNSRFEAGGSNTPLSSTVASRSGSASKPQPKPKPRGLYQLGSQGSVTGSGNSGSTPRKPVPPSKPSRSSVRVATPEHRT